MTDRLLRLHDVMRMTGIRRDTIYRLARQGEFPRPRKITAHTSAWLESEIVEWIRARPVSDLSSPNPKARAREVA